MPSNKWISLIDNAAKLCGSQSALALQIGAPKQLLSLARKGDGRLNAEQIGKLAALTENDPGALWDLQELANMPRRNPFGRSLSGALAAFFLVNLSGCFAPENSSWTRACAGFADSHLLHIVGLLRSLIQRMRRLRQTPELPMVRTCSIAYPTTHPA